MHCYLLWCDQADNIGVCRQVAENTVLLASMDLTAHDCAYGQRRVANLRRRCFCLLLRSAQVT